MLWRLQAWVLVLASCYHSLLTHAHSLGEECLVNEHPETASALMQHQKTAHSMLMSARNERKKSRQAQRRKEVKSTPRASKKGTLNLLQNQMNEYIEQKGKVGADPSDIQHIHNIKALIDETILPTVLANVEEARKQLEEMYQDILACGDKHGLEFNYSTSMTMGPSIITKEVVTDCIKDEDELITKVEEACEVMNRSRLSIYLPDGYDFPPPTVPDEEMIEYLKLMDEFFCGRYEVWHEEYTTCQDLQKNFTNTKMQCKKLQKTYETQHCSVSTKLDASCGDLDACYEEAVKTYRDKKQSVLETESVWIDEYEGATLISCLWEAWIYEEEPCTVNETKVRICHEVPPNLTNITIEFPPAPLPPSCGDEAFNAALGVTGDNGPVEVCSEEWTKLNYAELGLHQELLEELADACEPCPSQTWTAKPREISHLMLTNVEHAAGNAFVKTKGGETDCDAVIATEEFNVQSITITPVDLEQKIVVEIFGNESDLDYIMVMQNSIATIGEGGTSDDVAMYHDGDIMGIQISGGEVMFTKNGQVFHTDDNAIGMIAGQGKVTLCAKVGEEVQVDFGVIDSALVE